MLEKKEKVLEKKALAELERAKEFSKAKNKRGESNHVIANICFPSIPTVFSVHMSQCKLKKYQSKFHVVVHWINKYGCNFFNAFIVHC
jgi:hypothetical protein